MADRKEITLLSHLTRDKRRRPPWFPCPREDKERRALLIVDAFLCEDMEIARDMKKRVGYFEDLKKGWI